MNCPTCQAGCCLDHAAAPDPYIPPAPVSGPRLMRAWPADVRLFALAYTGAADQGYMDTALDLKRKWPAGLVQCSCEGGVVRNGEDDCSKCGGVGLYYQPESEAA